MLRERPKKWQKDKKKKKFLAQEFYYAVGKAKKGKK